MNADSDMGFICANISSSKFVRIRSSRASSWIGSVVHMIFPGG